ncbi:MAG: hypothetical protein JWL93_1260 [Hyphomicrobiales bacterium]|jgi:hypothetical protein|nr:hypothetical protein [Hyphomicrobiales bacterium]
MLDTLELVTHQTPQAAYAFEVKLILAQRGRLHLQPDAIRKAQRSGLTPDECALQILGAPARLSRTSVIRDVFEFP